MNNIFIFNQLDTRVSEPGGGGGGGGGPAHYFQKHVLALPRLGQVLVANQPKLYTVLPRITAWAFISSKQLLTPATKRDRLLYETGVY